MLTLGSSRRRSFLSFFSTRSDDNVFGHLHVGSFRPGNFLLVGEAAALLPALFGRCTTAGAIHAGIGFGAVFFRRNQLRHRQPHRATANRKQDRHCDPPSAISEGCQPFCHETSAQRLNVSLSTTACYDCRSNDRCVDSSEQPDSQE